MNIFVLCTGRSGSMTFIKACQHITNYTVAHESRSGLVGPEHFAYPANHIEADNRLSWFLGQLDVVYGNSAFYVHLKRDRLSTAKSFVNRYGSGIINAYAKTIIKGPALNATPLEVCLDYCDTVNINIEAFLKDKTRKMAFHLENAEEDFEQFWQMIGAEGNCDLALEEWQRPYNKTQSYQATIYQMLISGKIIKKINRIIRKSPAFIKSA
jgi:hypothetical protein